MIFSTAIATMFLILGGALVLPAQARTAEAPIAVEVSPPGDIPDNQAFITFKGQTGYSVKVPEGWARSDADGRTVFKDKYNHIALVPSASAAPVDEAYAKAKLVPDLQKNGRAVDNVSIRTVRLKGGPVVLIAYDSNSEPNPVTNKQVREENEAFFYVRDGKMVELILSAPKGADNVDQWKAISSSFRWN